MSVWVQNAQKKLSELKPKSQLADKGLERQQLLLFDTRTGGGPQTITDDASSAPGPDSRSVSSLVTQVSRLAVDAPVKEQAKS